jgi:hypothetical protein
MTTTHKDNIDLDMNLQARTSDRLGFGNMLFLAVDCFGSGGAYDGDRVATFASADEIKTAVDNGDLRYDYFKDLADQLDALDQNPWPIKVGLVDFDDYGTSDGAGADTTDAQSNPDLPNLYKRGYEACRAADDDFYFVCPDIADPTADYMGGQTNGPVKGDVLLSNLVDGAISDEHRLAVLQTDNDAWKTAGAPSNQLGTASGGLLDQDVPRWAFVYHPDTFENEGAVDGTNGFPDDGGSGDTAGVRKFVAPVYAARHATADQDIQSAPSDLELNAKVQMTEDLSASERDAIIDNGGNVALPLPPSDAFLDPGKTARGYAIFEIISVDWLYSRGSEALRELKLEYSSENEKIPLSEEGQEIVRNALGGVLSKGERIDHFQPGSTRVIFPDITDDDRSNDRIRADVIGTFEVSARNFSISVYLSR